MIQGCFRYCWAALTQSQGFFCSSPALSVSGLGVPKELGGDTAGMADPTWPKGYSMTHNVMLSNKKLGIEGGSRGTRSEWRRLSSQVTATHNGALLSWGWLNTCLLTGSGEGIPCFALLAHTAFALPIKPSLSQPTSFLTFTLWVPSPIPPGVRGISEQLCGA